MRKWLLLASVLLLVASLAGDVFFVHHHIDGFSLGAEHNPPQYTPDFLEGHLGILCAQQTLSLNAALNWSCGGADSVASCFCGWHSSAYLREASSPIC